MKHKDGIVRLSGNKYGVAGEKLSNFVPWVEENLGLDTTVETLEGEGPVIVAPPSLN